MTLRDCDPWFDAKRDPFSVLAFLSLACAPIPFLFYRYGHILRRKSKYIATNSLSQSHAAPPAKPEVDESPISPFDEKSRTRGSTPLRHDDTPIAQAQERERPLSPIPGSRSRLGYAEVPGRERGTSPIRSASLVPASRSDEGRGRISIPGSRSRLGYAQVDEVDPDEHEYRRQAGRDELEEGGVVGGGAAGYNDGVFRPLTDEEADLGMRRDLSARRRT